MNMFIALKIIIAACIVGNMHAHYDSVKRLLDRYQRPFTTIELNPQAQMISFSIAPAYDATCVMIDADSNDQLYGRILQAYWDKAADNCILLKRSLSLSELAMLRECEHPDVVFCWDAPAYLWTEFSRQWESAFDQILLMADHAFIEIPEYYKYMGQDSPQLQVARRMEQLLNERRLGLQQGSLWYVENHTRVFLRKFWGASRVRSSVGKYKFFSDFTQKKLYKRFTDQWTEWHKGINLRTFKKLNGVWPTRDHIVDQIRTFEHSGHNDFVIMNLVIQGRKIILIDIADPRRDATFKKHFNECLRAFGAQVDPCDEETKEALKACKSV